MNQVKRNDFIIKPYLKRNNLRAYYQIFSTLIPITALWLLVSKIINSSLFLWSKWIILIPILLLLTLLSSRTFSLMHDCGHNSLFEKRSLNNFFGFLLGFINGIPQKPWSNDHAFHHRHNGNWEVYKGPVDVISLEDYNNLSKKKKFFYRLNRHWFMLFPGGFFYLVIKPRLGLLIIIFDLFISVFVETFAKIKNGNFSQILNIKSRIKSPFSDYGDNFDELFDLISNNICVIIFWIFMSKWLEQFSF